MSFGNMVRIWFQCPKCGMRYAKYGDKASKIRFGTCANCGYTPDDKAEKEQKKVRKIGLILLIIGFVFFPVAFIVKYELLGVSGMLMAIGAILTIRSFVHEKYN